MTNEHFDQVCRVAHEANRAYCLAAGLDCPDPAWDEVRPDVRESVEVAVNKVLVLDERAEDLSDQPWDELTAAEQMKYRLFVAIVETLYKT